MIQVGLLSNGMLGILLLQLATLSFNVSISRTNGWTAELGGGGGGGMFSFSWGQLSLHYDCKDVGSFLWSIPVAATKTIQVLTNNSSSISKGINLVCYIFRYVVWK